MGFLLNMGSRQVIMALMYWDTPVLQWSVQFVAINFVFVMDTRPC